MVENSTSLGTLPCGHGIALPIFIRLDVSVSVYKCQLSRYESRTIDFAPEVNWIQNATHSQSQTQCHPGGGYGTILARRTRRFRPRLYLRSTPLCGRCVYTLSSFPGRDCQRRQTRAAVSG